MKKFFLIFSTVCISICSVSAQNTGIGTQSPSNKLTVVDVTADPIRLIGLQRQDAGTAAIGTVVADNNGVLKIRDSKTTSAINYTGSFNIVNNNTIYSFNDPSFNVNSVKVFDNLGEFNGRVFTAKQPGLYAVTFTVAYDQRANEGFKFRNRILSGTAGATTVTTPFWFACTSLGPENLGTNVGIKIGLTATATVLLAAGQVIEFQNSVPAGGNNYTAIYTITIFRVD